MQKCNLKSLEPRVITLPETKLVVKKALMSFNDDKTFLLWKGFSPLIRDISNRAGINKYSISIYPNENFFENFDPKKQFLKCAGIKVNEIEHVPESLEPFIIPSGLYAVFDYIGKLSEAAETFRYILTQWIHSSNYTLDTRPHLTIMGDKYKGEHPDSEEELLIPIR